jgi:hypothetical protein
MPKISLVNYRCRYLMLRMVEEYGNWFFVKPFNFVKPLKGFTLPTVNSDGSGRAATRRGCARFQDVCLVVAVPHWEVRLNSCGGRA